MKGIGDKKGYESLQQQQGTYGQVDPDISTTSRIEVIGAFTAAVSVPAIASTVNAAVLSGASNSPETIACAKTLPDKAPAARSA